MNRISTTKCIKSTLLVALVLIGFTIGACPAMADENRDELLQIIRQEDGALHAMAVDKLMSLNLSPEWWQYMLKRENKAYHTISNVAYCLLQFSNNMGWGDVAKLDGSGDASSPLVEQAMSSLLDKVHCTVGLTQSVKEQYRNKVIDNIALFEAPMTNDYYCKPRGRKLNLFISLDPNAQALQVQVSKDGTQYHFTIPSYVDLMTSPIQNGFKLGT